MPPRSTVTFKAFRGTFKLFSDAAEFATTLGKERLITISHSADHSEGVITVWYWAGAGEAAS